MPNAHAAADVIAELDARLAKARASTTASVRAVRRTISRDLETSSATLVREVAFALTSRDELFDRFVAAELLASHAGTMATLRLADLRRLGKGMDSWSDVDVFACYIAGPAWRANRVSEADVRRWAKSPDRWWRRAAVVSTVALNNRARGGGGDAKRTLTICGMVVTDRDPMVVKALSWALRELGKREPAAVRRFLRDHGDEMAALVKREVHTKLQTGRKASR